MSDKRPYFYSSIEYMMVPFGPPGVSVRAPNDEEKECLGRNCGECGRNEGDGVCLKIEDNGESGDGIILTIFTDYSKSDDAILWAVLTLRGAMSLRNALDSILRQREAESYGLPKGGDA